MFLECLAKPSVLSWHLVTPLVYPVSDKMRWVKQGDTPQCRCFFPVVRRARSTRRRCLVSIPELEWKQYMWLHEVSWVDRVVARWYTGSNTSGWLWAAGGYTGAHHVGRLITGFDHPGWPFVGLKRRWRRPAWDGWTFGPQHA